jgi:hypothetical protein
VKKLSYRSAVLTLVGLAVGALISALLWHRDGFEVAGWIGAFVVGAITLLGASVRAYPPRGPRLAPAKRAGRRLLDVLRHGVVAATVDGR